MGSYFIEAATMDEAEESAEGAAVVVEVEGGYMAFDTVTDYETWENQK